LISSLEMIAQSWQSQELIIRAFACNNRAALAASLKRCQHPSDWLEIIAITLSRDHSRNDNRNSMAGLFPVEPVVNNQEVLLWSANKKNDLSIWNKRVIYTCSHLFYALQYINRRQEGTGGKLKDQ